MRHLLFIIAILAVTACAPVEYGARPRTKSSLPPNLLARLPLLNIGDPHGDRYLTSKYDGAAREGSGGDMDVEVHYLFHGTEDRLIGFTLYFGDATFPACVKAISERFGPPSEMKTEPLSGKWDTQNMLNHIVIWHLPGGDLTAVEYFEPSFSPPCAGQIVFETKELAAIRQEWMQQHGISITPAELYSHRVWF